MKSGSFLFALFLLYFPISTGASAEVIKLHCVIKARLDKHEMEIWPSEVTRTFTIDMAMKTATDQDEEFHDVKISDEQIRITSDVNKVQRQLVYSIDRYAATISVSLLENGRVLNPNLGKGSCKSMSERAF
jgi:hypothetical protein